MGFVPHCTTGKNTEGLFLWKGMSARGKRQEDTDGLPEDLPRLFAVLRDLRKREETVITKMEELTRTAEAKIPSNTDVDVLSVSSEEGVVLEVRESCKKKRKIENSSFCTSVENDSDSKKPSGVATETDENSVCSMEDNRRIGGFVVGDWVEFNKSNVYSGSKVGVVVGFSKGEIPLMKIRTRKGDTSYVAETLLCDPGACKKVDP